jgi:hypothetical protein
MRHIVMLSLGLLALSVLSVGAAAQTAASEPPAVRLQPQDPGSSGGDAAGENATDLAKKLQNPIGDLYSFPFQPTPPRMLKF